MQSIVVIWPRALVAAPAQPSWSSVGSDSSSPAAELAIPAVAGALAWSKTRGCGHFASLHRRLGRMLLSRAVIYLTVSPICFD